MGDWERPNPARLNDTAALVRKGSYPETLETRSYCGVKPFETPWVPENAFNKKAPMMAVAGPYGGGVVVGVRVDCPPKRGGGADRNGVVPGNRGTLSVGIEAVEKSGRRG